MCIRDSILNELGNVAGEAILSTYNTAKLLVSQGSALDPTEGAYSALPDPLAGGEGTGCPSPRTSTPLLPFWLQAAALRALPTHFPIIPPLPDTLHYCHSRAWRWSCENFSFKSLFTYLLTFLWLCNKFSQTNKRDQVHYHATSHTVHNTAVSNLRPKSLT